MPVEQWHLERAVQIARGFGATRVVLFGSAVESPETARDLDIACEGVHGWDLFRLAARLERELGIPVDAVSLTPPSRFTRHVEQWGRELYAA